MAVTTLSDIIDVIVFQDLPAVNSPEKTAFWESGIVVSSPLINQLANSAGKTAELPFWNDLDETSAPNLTSDAVGTSATPIAISQGEQKTRKAFLNKGFSNADLAAELAMGPRAMEHIKNRIDAYWMRQWQRRLIASTVGIYADNAAADGSDMIYDVAGATNNDVTANTVFTRQNFTAAAFTLGDAVDGLVAIAVHSVVYKRMVDNDDIDFIPDSRGMLTIPTYLGKRVIVDDGLTYTAAAGAGGGDAAATYTSVLFGAGAFAYGEGSPLMPVEIERDAAKANGGGVETLWTRKTWILHPFGFQNTGTPASYSFSISELQAATTWSRVLARKNVPIAFLKTNG